MAFIEWNDQLSVGVSEMDKQHQRLVEMVNRLHDAMTRAEGADVLKTILNDLVLYTKVHFAAEERLMAAHGYPQLASHKLVHEQFAAKALELNAKAQAGKMVTSVGVSGLLKDWLVKHIQQEDRKYGQHICRVPC